MRRCACRACCCSEHPGALRGLPHGQHRVEVQFWVGSACATSTYVEYPAKKSSPEAMRRATFPHRLVLGDRGENLSSVLHGVCQDPERRDLLFRNLRSFMDGLMSEVQFLPDATGRLLLAVVGRKGARLSAPSVSEGVLRFLTVMAALLGFENPGVWFMDNIDAGFSPSKLGLVLEMLEHQAASSMRQLVVASHRSVAAGAAKPSPAHVPGPADLPPRSICEAGLKASS